MSRTLTKCLLVLSMLVAISCPVSAQTYEQAKKTQVEKALSGPNGAKILSSVKKYSEMYQIEQALILAVILTESGFNKSAVSSYGCSGLMQLKPSTFKARKVGNNIFDIDQNIHGGTKYLAGMIARYNGDVLKGLGSYNIGGGAFDRSYKNGKMHPAAKRYVDRVMYHKTIVESVQL